MKHQKTLYRIAAAGLALATLTAACFSFSWSRRHAIERLHTNAEQRLNHFSLSVFAPLDKYAYLPSLTAAYPATLDALQHPRDARRIRQANELLERLHADTGAAVIYLMNTDGLTIASSNWRDPQSFIGKSYAFRPYFIEALRTGRGSFYGLGVTTAVPGYYISRVVEKDKIALGVVVAKIDIHHLPAEWARDEHEVAVTDENGVIFLSSRDEWKYRPIRPLAAATMERLKRTRQYDGVLKAPLSIEIQKELRAGESIISVEKSNGKEMERISYFVKSRKLPASDWTINVLTSMEKIDADAWRAALLSVGAIALLLLLSMYLVQIHNRNKERKESRRALEQTLQALEEKHSALQAVTEELRQASITDPLTGVFNRRFFLETVVKMVSAANRHRQPLSIIMVDADHFKRINDEYGHPAGDKVLQTLAGIYGKALREDDIFARFGGEEFIMALPNTDERTAQLVAERLRETVMNHSVEIDGKAITVTVSSGVSRHRLDEKTIQAAIKRADDALYEAKNNGRNRVVVR